MQRGKRQTPMVAVGPPTRAVQWAARTPRSSGAGRVTAITPTEAPQKAAVTIPAQQSFVLQLPAGSKPAFLWGGDRWQSAPDHFKSHDYMAWVPFAFSADGSAVEPLAYAKTWQLQLAGA